MILMRFRHSSQTASSPDGRLGCLFTNPMMAAMLSVRKVALVVNVPIMAILCFGLVAVANLVAMLVARRNKKISAYGLITE